jgi:uncharacterized protein YdeI (YjbR/CyaY-like superfamily)
MQCSQPVRGQRWLPFIVRRLNPLMKKRPTHQSSWKEMNKMNPKPAEEESEPRVATDLRKALAATPMAKAQWRDLTPIARRDFISWIDSAKQPETRRRRIEKACSMLVAGKRRPCCYSIVSFNLYTALAATPMAKAQWSDLSPIERRDFISWMDSAKQPEAHRRRIEKACVMLAAGKRRPCCYSISKVVQSRGLERQPGARRTGVISG